MIELGRYQIDHVSRKNRLCPLCNSRQIEEEYNFLFECNKFNNNSLITYIAPFTYTDQ